jgi:hypothetical protein
VLITSLIGLMLRVVGLAQQEQLILTFLVLVFRPSNLLRGVL